MGLRNYVGLGPLLVSGEIVVGIDILFKIGNTIENLVAPSTLSISFIANNMKIEILHKFNMKRYSYSKPPV